MTPATKKLIKLLVEQAIAGLPEEPNPDKAEMFRDWIGRVNRILIEIQNNGYFVYDGPRFLKELQWHLKNEKEKTRPDPRIAQKSKQDARPFGRIPGVNDIRREKKPKPAL